MKILLFSFKELPSNWVFFSYETMFSKLDYSQRYPYLYLVNFESGSSMVNLYSIVWIALVFGVIFSLSILAYYRTKISDFGSKMIRIMSRISIRIFLLSFVFIFTSSFAEVYDFKRLSKGFFSYLCSLIICGF